MTVHQPILVEPIVTFLLDKIPSSDVVIVDCTFGGGGHSLAMLQKNISIIALDRDQSVIERAHQNPNLKPFLENGRLKLVHTRFGDLSQPELKDLKILGILADLGFSSDQIEAGERGLSFQIEGPLDMRMGLSKLTAWDVLQVYSEDELKTLFSEYGEEMFSGRIARSVVEARRAKQLPNTTTGFAEWIRNQVPKNHRFGRIHPATRVFQALRIEVNSELDELDLLINSGILKLEPGGRVAVLSFHSLEDRKVKVGFKNPAFKILTKKPIEADEHEVLRNPRSRSAKLRVAQKI